MIKTVIIDDELVSCNILKKMLDNYCSGIHVAAFAHTAADGVKAVKKHEPDLVFLDIEMPGGDGFYFLDNFREASFSTVFVTAYDQYAVKAFQFSALDYLLKPVNIEQLRGSVQKFGKQKGQPVASHYQVLRANHLQGNFNKIAIPTSRGYDFIDTHDIIWLQASDKYTVLYLKEGRQIVSSYNLGKYEELLCESHPFLRIHHSHIVNLNEITQLQRNKNIDVRMSDGRMLEVSVRKKEALLALISR